MSTAGELGSAESSYEVLARLATGGMAEIYLARGASAAGVQRYVVLKRILRERSHDESFVRMFVDEARLAAQLQHQNIAQVYDVGTLGESFFFTMEYVHGETVRAILQQARALARPVPIACILSIAAGAAAGLHHAHQRHGLDGQPLGIVHRDVSPSNLMVSFEGAVKVVDFGVAKAEHRTQQTRSGTVKGKISYLSPEQCRDAPIDRRSDLFSLGIVLWEMVTTQRLFRRGSDFETMQAIVSDVVPAMSQFRPDVPAELERMVSCLLEKDPAARFQTGDELHQAIDEVAAHTGSVLSSSGLARFLREQFGERPEPWVELQRAAPMRAPTPTAGMTAPLERSAEDPVDAALAALIDLAHDELAPEQRGAAVIRPTRSLTAPAVGFPTVRLDLRPPKPGAAAHDVPPSSPAGAPPIAEIRPSTLLAAATAPYVARPAASAVAPLDYARLPSTPPTVAAYGHAGPPPFAATVPMRAVGPGRPRATSRALRFGLVGAGVGVIAAIAIAATSRTSGSSAATADGHGASDASDGSDARVAAVRDGMALAIDATVVAIARDATTDAALAVSGDSTHTTDDDLSTPRPLDHHAGSAAATTARARLVAAAFDARQFDDVVTLCSGNRALATANAPTCTRAACLIHDSTAARRFYALAARDQRTRLRDECRKAGVSVDAATPRAGAGGNGSGSGSGSGGKPPCSDPFECQY